MKFREHKLDNGLEVVAECNDQAYSTALGFFVRTGARDETGKLIPLDVKVGDRVLYGKWSGTEVKVDGEDLLIVKESDILGIVTGTKGKKK